MTRVLGVLFVAGSIATAVVKPVNAHLAAIDRYLGRSVVARSRA